MPYDPAFSIPAQRGCSHGKNAMRVMAKMPYECLRLDCLGNPVPAAKSPPRFSHQNGPGGTIEGRLICECHPLRKIAPEGSIPARCARRSTATRQAGVRAVVPGARFHVPHSGRPALQSRPVAGLRLSRSKHAAPAAPGEHKRRLPATRVPSIYPSPVALRVPAVTSCSQRATPSGIAPPSPLVRRLRRAGQSTRKGKS